MEKTRTGASCVVYSLSARARRRRTRRYAILHRVAYVVVALYCLLRLCITTQRRLKKPSSLRVAILLYGVKRSSRLTEFSIKGKILDKLTEANVSYVIFHHRITVSDIIAPSVQETLPVTESGVQDVLIQENFGYFSSILNHGDAWGRGNRTILNMLVALTSLKRAAILSQKHAAAFDGLIVLRPDLLYLDELDVNLLKHAIHRRFSIVVPSWMWYDGCNDRFSYGEYGSMLKIAKLIDFALKDCKRTGKPFHSETFMDWNIKKNKLHVFSTHQRAIRVREDGAVAAIDHALLTPAEHNLLHTFASRTGITI